MVQTMSETAKTISVPPSIKAWVEGRYEPENELLFGIFHDYRKTKVHFQDNGIKESGLRMKIVDDSSENNDIILLIQHILSRMPVWNEATEGFRKKYEGAVIMIFFDIDMVTETDVLQRIWALRNDYEYKEGIFEEVTPRDDEVADIYQAFACRFAGVFDKSVDEVPTDPEIKSLKKRAAG